MRRFGVGLALGVLLALRLEAANVSFLVIETGLPEEPEFHSAHSGLWESGLLDVFFEAGHIVSNAPVRRLPLKPAESFPEAARPDLNEALAGGAEYFILALLEYPLPEGGEIKKPRRVSLRVFRTKPHTMLYEREFSDNVSTTLKDEYDRLRQAVRGLVPHIRN